MQYLKKLKADIWLPYFMPGVWRWLMFIIFVLGVIAGAYVWIYTLGLRGLW